MYSKQITSTIKNMIIFCRDVEKTASFYSDAVGLKVSHQSKQFVELKDYSNLRIILKQVDGANQILIYYYKQREAYNMKGYSPVLNFEVDDFENTVKKFQSYGAEKDGDLIDNEDYQMGFFKSPNGEMISIMKTKNQINSGNLKL